MNGNPDPSFSLKLPLGDGNFLAWDRWLDRLQAMQPAELGGLLEAVEEGRHEQSSWWALFLSYEAGLALAGLQTSPDTDGLPLALAWRLPAPGRTRTLESLPAGDWRPEWDEDRYGQAFERLRGAISAGDCYQANLTFRMNCNVQHAAGKEISVDAIPRMSAQVIDPGLRLWSRSPETFLDIDLANRRIESRPIKGTRRPGVPAASLAEDPKEQAEHVMIVDMVRNDLGRVCRPGSVRVPNLAQNLDLDYVGHLESRVCAELLPGAGLPAILRATMPPASISGTPKVAACTLLRQLEDSPRQAYCGTLGWISPDGRGLFSVLIRTAWRLPDGRARYGTGGGIVADSDAGREFEEAMLKTSPLPTASPDRGDA